MTRPSDFGLDQFAMPPDDGLSLEELSRAYAELMRRGAEPYDDHPPEDSPSAEDELAATDESLQQADAPCPLTPRSILEALLFVGHPENRPLESRQVAALMRGVRPPEIDQLVEELNQQYRAEHCPYEIRTVGTGYRLELRNEFAPLRDIVYGRQKAARLSQAAIDVLAIVAYQQPVTREQVDQLRGKPSSAVLQQLVKRQLLRIERTSVQGRRVTHYYTTKRFLDVFGLDSLDELPQAEDIDRL